MESSMKKLIIACMMLLSVMDMSAMPARKNTIKEVTLSDGTKVTAVLKGDENGHWWETTSGEYLLIDEDGNATVLSDFQKENISQAATARRAKSNARRVARTRSASQSRTAITGKKKGLVILVNFPDLTMKTSSPKAFFTRQFNEEGFSDNNHIGSVRDYFYDQSYGKLDIDFDVVGPVTVSKSYSYYGKNNNDGTDKYPCTMVAEACKLVNSQVNFADYDWDGDGEVDQVYLVYAGYGENAGAPANTIWPHEWTLDAGMYYYKDGNGALTLDGVKVDTYAVSCELADKSGSTPNGIGTACHEFSHCLGLPDFYDTSGNYEAWGMAAWDLMDSGSYSGPGYNGEVPSGYTSYERWCAGWLEPTVLTPGMEVKAQKPLADSPEAYIIYNDNNNNEYYLLENRQASRWFSYVEDYKAPGGLLIIHVDYDKTAWDENTPNGDATHERMTPFLANNQKGLHSSSGYRVTQSQYQGHLYPYNANDLDSLTNTSKPAAKLYNANTDGTYYMNKGVYGITKYADGTIGYSCRACASVNDGTPSGITETKTYTKTNGHVYSITGQDMGTEINTLPAGIYIYNGKKYIRK